MEIKATDVKKLRDATGAGMMECKKALEDSGGDIDAGGMLRIQQGSPNDREAGGSSEAHAKNILYS